MNSYNGGNQYYEIHLISTIPFNKIIITVSTYPVILLACY